MTFFFFRLHTSRMSLSEDVDLEEFVTTKDELSGADIKAVCTEAGLLALRERRMRVTKADFTEAREKVCFYVMPVDDVKLIAAVIIGAVQEERGHARGSVLVVSHRFCTLVYTLYYHGFYSKLVSMQFTLIIINDFTSERYLRIFKSHSCRDRLRA